MNFAPVKKRGVHDQCKGVPFIKEGESYWRVGGGGNLFDMEGGGELWGFHRGFLESRP